MVSSTTHSANSAPSADKAHERFSAMLHMQSTVTDEGEEGEELVLEKVVEDSGGEDEKDNGKGDGDGGETLPAVGNCRPEKIEEEGDCIVGQMRGQHDVRRQMKRKAVLGKYGIDLHC